MRCHTVGNYSSAGSGQSLAVAGWTIMIMDQNDDEPMHSCIYYYYCLLIIEAFNELAPAKPKVAMSSSHGLNQPKKIMLPEYIIVAFIQRSLLHLLIIIAILQRCFIHASCTVISFLASTTRSMPKCRYCTGGTVNVAQICLPLGVFLESRAHKKPRIWPLCPDQI